MKSDEKILSPTLAYIIDMLTKEEIEKSVLKWKQEGRDEGRKEGSVQAKIGIAIELIKEGFSDEKIAKLTKFTLEEVEKIRKSLE